MLYPHFKNFIKEHLLIAPGDKLLVAVSGGLDSVTLLSLLLRLKRTLDLEIEVAHVNFKLRGKDSDRDEKFVRDICDELNVPCHVLKKRPPSGKNIQNSARDIRYKFFADVAKKTGANKVAVAHHADDNAETIILHLIRGTGLEGLLGMGPKSEFRNMIIIRPLIFAARDEILSYAKENRIKFRTDITNRTDKYSRNLVRLKVIPFFKKMNPKFALRISAMTKALSDDNEALSAIVFEAYKGALIKSENEIIILSRADLKALPKGIRKRVFRLAFSKVSGSTKDLNSDQLSKMDEMITRTSPAASYRLPASVKFFIEGDCITLARSVTNFDR